MDSVKTKTNTEKCKEIITNENGRAENGHGEKSRAENGHGEKSHAEKGHGEKGHAEKGHAEEALRREREAVKELLPLSDEEILDIIRKKTEELGRVPKKAEVPGASYIKRRFGPWHRVLEAAGVREVTPERIARLNAKKNKKRRRAQ